MPPESQQTIEDFLTFVEQERNDRDRDRELWDNLRTLEESLAQTEDKPAKIAKAIKAWCKQFNIVLNREQLADYRINMAKKGKSIPKPTPGEQPDRVYNKALIVDTVKAAREERSP